MKVKEITRLDSTELTKGCKRQQTVGLVLITVDVIYSCL